MVDFRRSVEVWKGRQHVCVRYFESKLILFVSLALRSLYGGSISLATKWSKIKLVVRFKDLAVNVCRQESTGNHHLFECQPSVARHWTCVVLCGRICTFTLQTVVGLQQFREAAAGVLVMRCATVCRFPVATHFIGSHWSFVLGAHMNAVCVVTVTCRSLSFLCGKSSGRQSSPLRGWQ